MIPPKPPRPIVSHPKPQRLTERSMRMTLVAAFRCRENGILLCADREENDGFLKREVDKIYHFDLACKIGIRPNQPYQVFIAGAGPTAILTKASIEIHECLRDAVDTGVDILAEHRTLLESILETTLNSIRSRYVTDRDSALFLIIIFASANAPPLLYQAEILYQAEGVILELKSIYAAQGNGKPISDYLANRLYKHGLYRETLALLAAFIFREAGRSSSGVGLEVDMKLIHEGGKSVRHIGPNYVKELMDGVPSLEAAISSYWEGHVRVPDWLKKD